MKTLEIPQDCMHCLYSYPIYEKKYVRCIRYGYNTPRNNNCSLWERKAIYTHFKEGLNSKEGE